MSDETEIKMEPWVTPERWLEAVHQQAWRESQTEAPIEEAIRKLREAEQLTAMHAASLEKAIPHFRRCLTLELMSRLDDALQLEDPEMQVERTILQVNERLIPGWILHNNLAPHNKGENTILTTLGSLSRRVLQAGDPANGGSLTHEWEEEGGKIFNACMNIGRAEQAMRLAEQAARHIADRCTQEIRLQAANAVALTRTRHRQDVPGHAEEIKEMVSARLNMEPGTAW